MWHFAILKMASEGKGASTEEQTASKAAEGEEGPEQLAKFVSLDFAIS